MKYQEITKNEFSDKIGSVKIGAQNVQLCDHIQVVNGRYHVSALFTDEKETKALNDMGATTKKMYNGTQVAYLNEEMLQNAKPIYQDGMTADLISRLIKAMKNLNAQRAAA
ncbi:MAG: hypothetical protein GW778_07180 [Alphaproteobacteria bacterium]|nr:hypothetical protein [Alphaproteobacteria bacterium]